MKIKIDSSHHPTHPTLSILHKGFAEAGISISESNSNVLLIIGKGTDGFSSAEIKSIDKRLVERFSGAEMFLLARSFPFARIRCGLNKDGQLIIASPLDNEMVYRLVRLLQQHSQGRDGNVTETVTRVENPITEPPPSSRWNTILDTLGLNRLHQRQNLPLFIQENAAAADVLRSTTAHDTAQNEHGIVFHLYGFPDLLRPTSRVILIAPDGGIVALHRGLTTTGINTPDTESFLLSRKSITEISLERTNAIPPQKKNLFALDHKMLYFSTDREIISWDGRKRQSVGQAKQVLASLLLHWSQR